MQECFDVGVQRFVEEINADADQSYGMWIILWYSSCDA